MSEKKGPFDFTIWTIRKAREKLRIDDPCPICDMDAAIRVLEAAGKVNKKSSIRELDAMYKSRIVDLTEHSRGGNIQFDFSLELKETADINYQLIRALLESLPEKEE